MFKHRLLLTTAITAAMAVTPALGASANQRTATHASYTRATRNLPTIKAPHSQYDYHVNGTYPLWNKPARMAGRYEVGTKAQMRRLAHKRTQFSTGYTATYRGHRAPSYIYIASYSKRPVRGWMFRKGLVSPASKYVVNTSKKTHRHTRKGHRIAKRAARKNASRYTRRTRKNRAMRRHSVRKHKRTRRSLREHDLKTRRARRRSRSSKRKGRRNMKRIHEDSEDHDQKNFTPVVNFD